jgi:two-component system, NarL family, sensor kinase
MTKYFKKLGNHLILVCLGLLVFLTFSCNEGNEKKQDKKPWHHKDVIPVKLKWFLNSNNYTDSNYKERFKTYYQEYLSQNHTDSALYCLLVYGEMLDQNYIYDTLYLYTAKEHLKKYESVSTEEGEIIKLYYYIGSQYEANSEYKLAEQWFNNGLKHPDVLPKTKIRCVGMLAQTFLNTNQPEKALPLQLERLKFYEKEKDTVNVGVAFANLASTYNVLNAHQIAIEHISKSIRYSRLKHDTNTLIPYITNYFTYKKNADDNFKYIQKDKELLSELNLICDTYINLSPYNDWVRLDINFHFYWKENMADSMKATIEKMEVINKILNNPSFENKLKYLNSRYNHKIGNAIINEKELIKMAEYYAKNEIWWEAWRTNIMLYEAAENKGDYKRGLQYFKNIYDIEIKRLRQNAKGQVYELDVKYQTAKKDQEILIQAEKLKIKQQNIGLLIAGLVIAVLAFVIYLIWQKQKLITQKRKNETLFTQKLMENTEEERMRIAKDLHDSIGHELLNVKSAISNKLQFTEDKIDHILAEVREISRNLFPVMFEEVGLKISVEQLIEQIIKSDGLFVIGDINYIAGTLDTKAELNIYRIIQEALSNVRKYAQAQSAKVSINQTNNVIDIQIMDNGKGFDVMEVLKQGKAFGLMSINQRCLALKSAVSIESGASGTVISFQIKL